MEITNHTVETQKWRLEFWKGRYGEIEGHSVSSGCEIGLYYKKGAFTRCAYQENRRIRMRMSLYKKGYSKKMFTRDSKTSTKQGKSWWLTAFQPYYYMPGKKSAGAGELKMTGTLWFNASGKYKSEMKSLSKALIKSSGGSFKAKRAGSWKKVKFTWGYK